MSTTMVKYLEYNGVEIPYSIGYYALKRFKGETGKDFEKTPEDDLEAIEVIMWYAVEAGCKIDKVENPLNRDDVELFVNECMTEFNESVPDFFQTPPKKNPRTTGASTTKPKPKRKASSQSKKPSGK